MKSSMIMALWIGASVIVILLLLVAGIQMQAQYPTMYTLHINNTESAEKICNLYHASSYNITQPSLAFLRYVSIGNGTQDYPQSNLSSFLTPQYQQCKNSTNQFRVKIT